MEGSGLSSLRLLSLALCSSVFFAAPESWARLGIQYQMALGNPDGASTNSTSRTKFLIQRSQYAISYNDDTHQANWVSWSYSTDDDGSQARTDAWAVEELLPSGYLRIGTATFGTSFGINWDRGHMTPSADRTLNFTDNAATFRMSNIIPQADANNQGLWAQFETYCRGLAAGENEVLIISGPSEFTGNRIPNSMSVPGSVWKIAVVIPNATSTTPANQRVSTSARVIAILTPNVSSGLGTWQSYITSVEQIEEVTGFNFFSEVDASTAVYLKNVVDSGTAPNSPTVITAFSPTLGAVGSSVVISGYNFNASSTVQFNGVDAAVTFNNQNQLTATVPPGATSGLITVSGSGGIDTSYGSFTVTTGPATPTITVSPSSISGMTATEGLSGAVRNYAVNGSSLTSPVVITAPTHFEISTNGTTYFPSVSLTPAVDGSLGTQVSVRIQSSATVGTVSGTITHASTGATTRNVSVAGTVASSAPYITVSTASLTGFAALQGSTGGSKSYTVSGANLTGSITITAPNGYEVSLDNAIYAPTRILVPVSGTIAATTVYARLSATAPVGSNTGSIGHAGGSAATQTVSVSGTVSASGGASSDVSWDFQTVSPTSGVPAGMTVGNLNQGNNNGTTTLLTATSGSTGYTGASGNNNAGAAARIGALNTASGGSAYFEFTVTPANAGIFTLTEISFGARSTSTGPQAYTLRSSTDNYASDIATGVIPNNSTWTLKSNTGLVQTYSSATTFRLYGYNGSGSASAGTANWRIDDLKITVSTGSSSTPSPVITVSGPATATALQSFTYQIVANNSPTSYGASGLPEGLSINTTTGVISGTPTTPGSYPVGLTASNAGGDGTASLTINVQVNPNAPVITSNLIASGQVNTPFSYQIVASNSPTSYTAANLPAGLSINTSTGLITGAPTTGGTINVTITAVNSFGNDAETLQITIRVPTLTLTPATLNAFTANSGFISTTQSYTLTGSELTAGITVRAPQYFEISTDGANFVGETTLSPAANGTLSQAIMVRVAATAPPGLNTGAISHTGSGVTPKYLEVSATVSTSEPTLTLSTTSLAAFSAVAGSASTMQSYEVSGASLTGMITLTPPAGFEIGLSEGNFRNTIQLTPTNGALTATVIYVRLRAGAAAGSYVGNITHVGGGSATKNVSVSGTITAPIGPKITSTSGGSAYVSASYSYTIPTDGLQTVTSYGATGLPAGLSVNTSTGVISGAPTVAGTYNVTLIATGAQGTSSKAYTLRVITMSEQPSTPTVVINKYHNATTDRIELLVTGDNLNGPPVDLRGMIIKDFNSNMATDGGGKYVFANHPLWANVKAGTLIVLAAGNTLGEDFNPADNVLAVNLANATFFREESGGFDIGNIDMVMIKPAGMQPDGVAGGMHALAAANNPGTQYNTFSGRKTRARRDLSFNRGYYCYIINGNARLTDFYATEGADLSTTEEFGTGNNSNNTTYINSLLNQDQDGPNITVLGVNPIEIAQDSSYTDAGATAFDVGDNASKTVTTSGTVNMSVAGTYTLTYTGTDSKGNIGMATRTVTVLAPANTPPIVGTAAATEIKATSATLGGNVTSTGTSAVTARGFVYSTMSNSLTLGALGVWTTASGSGSGTFTANISALTGGTVYYFRSYATSGVGTSYGDTRSFTTLKAEPLAHAANFAAGMVTSSNIPAQWAPVQADGYLLVVSSSAQNTPTDGNPVSDDNNLSDGTAAVNLSGTAESYGSFNGFTVGVNYTFRLYPYNNSGSSIDYRAADAPSFTAALLTTPVLIVSGTPAPLTTTYGTPSAPTPALTLSGSYLTSPVNVSAPPGFEISDNQINFGSSVALVPVAGTLTNTTVSLRLAATAGAGGDYNAKMITISGGGASSLSRVTAGSGNSVAPKPITVGGLMAANKVYDGNTNASVMGTPSYGGLVNNESFAVTNNITWAFPGKNAGTNQSLVASGQFTSPSPNYTLASQPALTADISRKPLSVSGASVITKVYDGNAAATITGATLVGVVEGDSVTVSGSGNFNDANAGENKPVTASLTLGGAGAGNYSLVQPELTGTISKAGQTIDFALAANPVNAGTTNVLSATAGSGMPVAFASANTNVAIISNQSVVALAPGVTTITASQAGDANFEAAPTVSRALKVAAAGGGGGTNLIAGWDFQTTNSGGTAVAASPTTPKIFHANFGSGTIYLDGSNGSSDWFVGATNTELSGFIGTSINASNGLSSVVTSPSALALIGGSTNAGSPAANGKRVVLKFSMTGYTNLNVSFAAQRSSSGFTSQLWELSTNGISYATVGNLVSGSTAGTIQTNFINTGILGFSGITNLAQAADAYLRITFSGATSTNGNNRLDNVQLMGVQASSGSPAITPSGTFGGLTTIYGSSSGSSGPVLVSGGSLTSNITAAVPDPFQVSADGVTWAGTATFTNDGGFASGNLFLRLRSNAPVGTYTGQGVSLVAGGASNRTVAIPSSTVNPLAITVTALATNKVYGTPDPTLPYTHEPLLFGETFTGNLVRDAGSSVGTYTIRQGTLTNANYAINFLTNTFEITPAPLEVTGASVQSKTYDGNTSADLLGGTLFGKVGGDDVSLAANPTGTFASPEVGTWPVETSFVLTGMTKNNYYLNQPTNLTGTITAGATLGGWSSSYGLTGNNAVANADPDGDGWKNVEEYAFGLNPTNRGGSLASLQQTNNEVKLTFLQKETGGITYAVKSATNLSGGLTNSITPQPSADTNGVPAGYKRYEATMSTTNERGFMKVEATLP